MQVVGVDNFVREEAANAAEIIQFAVSACDIGKIIVARSMTGVCAILPGTNAEELESELGKIFPGDVLVRHDRALSEDVSKVLKFLSYPNGGLDITLDIRGTAFQRKVWEALRTIPVGHALTFTQLACRIPGAKSLRAIGQACADNPLSLAVPCHRVIGNSGSLRNYRYSAQCKRSLINHEMVAA
jgi:AraC family transcriptional regulator of adaptative response/methylated-DNA-[protein]-cysteine methyltransferase